MKKIYFLIAIASTQLSAAQPSSSYSVTSTQSTPNSNYQSTGNTYNNNPNQFSSSPDSYNNNPAYNANATGSYNNTTPNTSPNSYNNNLNNAGNPNQYNNPNNTPNQYNNSNNTPNQYNNPYNNTSTRPYNSTSTSNNGYNQSSDAFGDNRTSDDTKYPQDSAATESDRQINRKIREKLGGWFSSGYNDTLILRTANGIVIIEGTVEKPSDVGDVTDAARKIDGVKTVNARISVEPKNADRSNRDSKLADASQANTATSQDYAATDKDRQLNQRIRDKLSTWFSSGYNDTIILKTSNGDVTLEGRVNNPEDIQRIVDSLRRIDGVNNITNRLNAKRGSVPV